MADIDKIQSMSRRVGGTAKVDLERVDERILDRLEGVLVETRYQLDAMAADLRREHGLEPREHER